VGLGVSSARFKSTEDDPFKEKRQMSTEKQRLQGGQLIVWMASEYHAINFALMARIRGTFPPDSFQKALDKLVLKYPSLAVNVVQDT
jgi:hypothetical protein